MKKLLLLFCFVSVALAARAASDYLTYTNPVFAHDWADPSIWRGDDGRMYTFSTSGTGIFYGNGRGKFLYSDDMIHWDTIPDYVWTNETLATLKTYGNSFWAPHIVKHNGKWLMYLTCYTSAAHSSIVVLSFPSSTFPDSDGKCGPWTFEGLVTSSTDTGIDDTIDPFVVQDPNNQRIWMFFGSVGGEYRVELTTDGLRVAGKAQYVHVGGKTIGEDATRSKVFEGAYLYQHDGYWYYFVSTGNYWDHTYTVKVCRGKTLGGSFYDKEGNPMTEGNATTILSSVSSSSHFTGPGHNGEIFVDEGGRTYMYYHCHVDGVTSTVAGYNPRCLMLQQLYWDDDGWPYFANNGHPLYQNVWPANMTYTLTVTDAKWATLYLPYGFEIPEGLNVYTVSDIKNSTLVLSSVSKPVANKPYLVYAQPGAYELSGFMTEELDAQTNGKLKGSASGTKLAAGTYVLQNQNGKVGFYRVKTSNVMSIGERKAYVVSGSYSSAAERLYMPGDEEEAAGIDNVGMDDDVTDCELFDITGRPATLRSGLLIERSPQGARKVIIR